MNTMHCDTNSIHSTISYAFTSYFNIVYALTLVYMTIIFLKFNRLGKELALLYILWVFLHYFALYIENRICCVHKKCVLGLSFLWKTLILTNIVFMGYCDGDRSLYVSSFNNPNKDLDVSDDIQAS